MLSICGEKLPVKNVGSETKLRVWLNFYMVRIRKRERARVEKLF